MPQQPHLYGESQAFPKDTQEWWAWGGEEDSLCLSYLFPIPETTIIAWLEKLFKKSLNVHIQTTNAFLYNS